MVILYPLPIGGVAVVIPVDDALPLSYIAAKDVPAGVPYRIVPRSALPIDHTYRDAWIVDFSTPDGYGAHFGVGGDLAVVERRGDTLFIRDEQTGALSTLEYPTV